jgi:hypothetical protein
MKSKQGSDPIQKAAQKQRKRRLTGHHSQEVENRKGAERLNHKIKPVNRMTLARIARIA